MILAQYFCILFLSLVKGIAKLNMCPRFSLMGDVENKVNN
jgi:hypothetical protein